MTTPDPVDGIGQPGGGLFRTAATPRLSLRRRVELAPYTTLELGGPARFFTEITDDRQLAAALRWAERTAVSTRVIGGGSNLLVADRGFDGLVARMATRGVSWDLADGERVLVTAKAGEPWDDFVQATVSRGLWGVECLSGIPGSVGATPIQNVGAYGHEVDEVISSVHVLDRTDLTEHDLPRDACGFAYRDSRFKREPGRFAVLSVTFALQRGGSPPIVRHGELAERLRIAADITPERTRSAVLSLRRMKSMVIEPDDPNRRSVGSFFLNPLLSAGAADEVAKRAVAAGTLRTGEEMPRYPAGPDTVKLSAAWLIERAGFRRGFRRGHVGISTNHVLALVHHGGGTTAELLSLADEIRGRVSSELGVSLELEPVALGFGSGAADPRV